MRHPRSPLNEGREVNPDDTGSPADDTRLIEELATHCGPLNEGREVNPDDTRLGLERGERSPDRSTKVGRLIPTTRVKRLPVGVGAYHAQRRSGG